MAMGLAGYESLDVAKNYAEFRPDYPPQLYEKIMKYLDDGSEGSMTPKRELALDVGCGAGQSTKLLAEHFEKVLGVDSSEAQLAEARKSCLDKSNVEFKFSTAEDLSAIVEDESVDLVTVGTALHWFEVEKFYRECLRVLKPGGVLAAYVNYVCLDEPEVNKVLQTLFRNVFESYWQPGTDHYFDKYAELFNRLSHFFSQCVRDDTVSLKTTRNIKQFVGLFESCPQFIYYKKDNPQHPNDLDIFFERLQLLYGTQSMNEKVIGVSYPVVLIMGRKI